jgi:hypothetical protein
MYDEDLTYSPHRSTDTPRTANSDFSNKNIFFASDIMNQDVAQSCDNIYNRVGNDDDILLDSLDHGIRCKDYSKIEQPHFTFDLLEGNDGIISTTKSTKSCSIQKVDKSSKQNMQEDLKILEQNVNFNLQTYSYPSTKTYHHEPSKAEDHLIKSDDPHPEYMQENHLDEDNNKEVYCVGRYNEAVEYIQSNPIKKYNRIDELSRTHFIAAEKRKVLLQESEKAELEKCTFSPILSHGTKVIVKKLKDFTSGSKEVSERLHAEAEKKNEKQNILRAKLEENNTNKYPFKPQLITDSNKFSTSLDHRPIHERLGDIQRSKNSKMQELEECRKNREKEMTFHPSIDNNSRKILMKKFIPEKKENLENFEPNDVVSRLLHEGMLAKERKKQLQLEREKLFESQSTPIKSCRGTNLIAKSNPVVRFEIHTYTI